VKRISNEYGEGKFGFLWRLVHVPAYRCAPCRNRFFSIFPLKHGNPAQSESSAEKPAVTGK
jgi:hypothetical protein